MLEESLLFCLLCLILSHFSCCNACHEGGNTHNLHKLIHDWII